jgi:hypothetical protein
MISPTFGGVPPVHLHSFRYTRLVYMSLAQLIASWAIMPYHRTSLHYLLY